MEEHMMSFIWLAVIIIMAIAEGATAQLISIWFVVGGIAALIVSMFSDSILLQVVVFTAVTLVTLAFTRPIVNKMMHFKKEETNAGRYIGKTGLVVMEINNQMGMGQVNVSGSIWTARSVDGSVVPKGSNVLVEQIEGVKLIVSVIP